MGADDTTARFPGMAAGYESFYLRAAHPDGGLGVWIRHTVHRRPGTAPTGSLWFTLFDADAPAPLATKITVPSPDAGADWIRIAGARLGDGTAIGRITDPAAGGPEVSWDLRFGGAPTLRHLPRGWMYRAPLPRTKPISLHPHARFDGTVTVGGRTLRLDNWPGMVGHNWGSQHAQRWIWLHGMGFNGSGAGSGSTDGAGDGTWLDVVLARIAVAGRTTPWIAAGAVSLHGERLALGGPLRARATEVAEEPTRLRFVLPGRGVRVSGHAHAPAARFVGWVYGDPDGSAHHTVNCSIADLTMTVARPGRPAVTLSCAGLAAYELGMREHDHGIPIQPYPDGSPG